MFRRKKQEITQEIDMSTLVDETLKVTPKMIEFFKDLDRDDDIEFEKFASEVNANIEAAEREVKRRWQ